jgi:hypothetical protein
MPTSQENSATRDNSNQPEPVATTPDGIPTNDGMRGVNPTNDVSLPEGGDVRCGTATGGSKSDPVSTGLNVKDTIAGRN